MDGAVRRTDTRSAVTSSVIARFRTALESVQDAELKRLYARLPTLSEQSRVEIRRFSNRIVANVLDAPLKSLDQDPDPCSSQPLVDALERLFRLNRVSEQTIRNDDESLPS